MGWGSGGDAHPAFQSNREKKWETPLRGRPGLDRLLDLQLTFLVGNTFSMDNSRDESFEALREKSGGSCGISVLTKVMFGHQQIPPLMDDFPSNLDQNFYYGFSKITK